jgi:hypothetical protein
MILGRRLFAGRATICVSGLKSSESGSFQSHVVFEIDALLPKLHMRPNFTQNYHRVICRARIGGVGGDGFQGGS